MKAERLYAITVYLLNHGRMSANELANYFEVSVRTIQRDIDSLCLSGIPIVAIAGAAGGYEISEQFKLDKHFVCSKVKNDYRTYKLPNGDTLLKLTVVENEQFWIGTLLS